jgi:hypothetical protein
MFEQFHLDLHQMRTDELARAAELKRLAAEHAAASAATTGGADKRTRRRAPRRAARHPWGLPSGASHAWFA